jgi:hypothetical protein
MDGKYLNSCGIGFAAESDVYCIIIMNDLDAENRMDEAFDVVESIKVSG